MTKEEQRALAMEIVANIGKQVEACMDSGDVPEGWDGKEIRELVADVASEFRYGVDPRGKRTAEAKPVLKAYHKFLLMRGKPWPYVPGK